VLEPGTKKFIPLFVRGLLSRSTRTPKAYAARTPERGAQEKSGGMLIILGWRDIGLLYTHRPSVEDGRYTPADVFINFAFGALQN
jgi:hypothetical protein